MLYNGKRVTVSGPHSAHCKWGLYIASTAALGVGTPLKPYSSPLRRPASRSSGLWRETVAAGHSVVNPRLAVAPQRLLLSDSAVAPPFLSFCWDCEL